MQHHKYNLYDIENMYPFERDLYVEMLGNYIKELESKNKKESFI
jgi:hypothetical protein